MALQPSSLVIKCGLLCILLSHIIGKSRRNMFFFYFILFFYLFIYFIYFFFEKKSTTKESVEPMDAPQRHAIMEYVAW